MCVFNTLYILFKYMINYVISSLCLYLTFNTLSFYTHRLHTLYILFTSIPCCFLFSVYSSIPYLAILLYIVLFYSVFSRRPQRADGTSLMCHRRSGSCRPGWWLQPKVLSHGSRSSVCSHLRIRQVSGWLNSACCWGIKWRKWRES